MTRFVVVIKNRYIENCGVGILTFGVYTFITSHQFSASNNSSISIVIHFSVVKGCDSCCCEFIKFSVRVVIFAKKYFYSKFLCENDH